MTEDVSTMGIPMNHMREGQSGRILESDTQGGLRQRAFDLGLTPGRIVEWLMSRPIGDPSCYRVRGGMIALRGSDAEQIRVAVMLPPMMMIFFPIFTFLEDVGYLPRVAFNLDRLFRWAGAHGRQAMSMAWASAATRRV